MEYTIEEIQAIVRELLKYEAIQDSLCYSDEEENCEYDFDSNAALEKLMKFTGTLKV